MKRTFLLLCIALMMQVLSLQAQELDRITDLRFYADVMANAELPDSRIRGEAKFNELLHADLEQNGFWANYDSIAWLQSVLSSDSTFRILTWQLEEDEGKHKYFGIVQLLDGSIIELQDRRRLNSEFSNYDQDTWYGALYYGLEEFKLEDGSSAWIVLGFNANDLLTNIKVADVLTFNDDRTALQLGKPVFKGSLEDGEEVKHRIILQYADAASARMRFDRERSQLVYDHTVLINAGPEGAIWVPDGSFHAYQYVDFQWGFVAKVFNETVDTPPGEGLKTDGQRDILGRKKN